MTQQPVTEYYSEVEIMEFLRRLGVYAADRLTRNDAKRMRALAEPVRYLNQGREITIDVPLVLKREPANVRELLMANSDAGAIFRLSAPLESIVPRPKRENIMRAVAGPLSAYGVTMAERWASNVAPLGWADSVVDHTLAALGSGRDEFSKFVRSCVTFNWIIAADFCIADKTKENDVFAFTVYAVDDDVEAIIERAQRAVSRDYKDTRDPSAAAIEFLASNKRFTFAFIPTRQRRVISDVATARTAIDLAISAIAARRDADRFAEELRQWRALRQEAAANSFRFRLFENMTLTAALAGVIGMLLAGEGRARMVSFIPDRDAMTEAYGGVMLGTFATNAWSFTLRKHYPPLQFALGTAGIVLPGQPAWFDPLIRVPDFVAGVLAGLNFGGETQFIRPDRDQPLLRQVLADNPNIVVIAYPELTLQSITSHRVLFSRTPFV